MIRVWCLLFLIFSGSGVAGNLAIMNVHADKEVFYPAKGEAFRIQYQLTEPAKIVLKIYDGRDLLVREMHNPDPISVGEQEFIWDGRDQSGQWVPDEAYLYVLEATASDGRFVRYDTAELTGGDDIEATQIKWDPVEKRIHYRVNHAARVCVRVGMKQAGPLLATVVDWVARSAGEQSELWDGFDASGVLDLASHPDMMIGVLAYRLPDNTVIVGEPATKVSLIEKMNWNSTERIKIQEQKKRMYAHSQQTLETRGDYSVQLQIPDSIKRNEENVPVISEITPIRLEIDEKDLNRVINRRFEPVFFVDGQYQFENEVGFVPMTWNWDPSQINNGIHYITVNVRGYEGNFGMATIKVQVNKRVIE